MSEFIKRLDTDSLSDSGYKAYRYSEIDYRTTQLISAGFTFDGEVFSLSANAQRNWDSIKTSKPDYTFPLDITLANNDTYVLSNADVQAFWTAARDAMKANLDSGRVLKKSIFDAATRVIAEAVIDNR